MVPAALDGPAEPVQQRLDHVVFVSHDTRRRSKRGPEHRGIVCSRYAASPAIFAVAGETDLGVDLLSLREEGVLLRSERGHRRHECAPAA